MQEHCPLPHFHGLLTQARGLKGIFGYPQTHWVWIIQKAAARSRAGALSCLRESCFPPVWVLLFLWVWCHHSARSAPPRPPGKQNRGMRPECQMQKTSRSDSSYPPSPFLLWKELSSWLYTTRISLIEKESERSRVSSFQFLLSSSQK